MRQQKLKNLFMHISLILVSLLCIFPFLWMLSTALKGVEENIFQYPPKLIPQFPTLENFKSAWNQIPFLTYYLNSFIVAFFTVILNLILDERSDPRLLGKIVSLTSVFLYHQTCSEKL